MQRWKLRQRQLTCALTRWPHAWPAPRSACAIWPARRLKRMRAVRCVQYDLCACDVEPGFAVWIGDNVLLRPACFIL